MTRTFRACEGRTVTLPASVKAGPGATTMQLKPGCVVTLTEDECVQNARFVAGRLRAGDLEELSAADAEKLAAEAPEPAFLPKPGAFDESMPIEHGLGLGKKGGSK